MWITREQVIEAIKTETLKRGKWVALIFDITGTRTDNNPNCSVCAVGAVLRHKGFDNIRIDRLAPEVCFSGEFTRNASSINAKRQKDWLGLLSIKFENLCAEYKSQLLIKKKLISYVKQHFPTKFKLHGVE